MARSSVISLIMDSTSSCDVFAHSQGQRQEVLVCCTSGVVDCTTVDELSSPVSADSVAVVFCVVIGWVIVTGGVVVVFVVTFDESVVVVVKVVVVLAVVDCSVGSVRNGGS